MRLTLINQFYPPDLSPTARLAAAVAEHRAARGDEVTILASGGRYADPSVAGPEAARHVQVVRIWAPRLGKASLPRRLGEYSAFYAGALLAAATLRRQDVVISLTTPPYVVAAALLHKAVRSTPRVVLWSMDCYPEAAERSGVIREGAWLSRGLRALNRRLLRHVDHVVCLDGAMQALLRANYERPDRPLATSVVPTWEAADAIADAGQLAPWTRAEALGLAGQFVVLYLGNAGVGHRFETVVDAAAALSDAPVRFLFVGGGSGRSALEALCDTRSLDNVVLHGYVPEEERAPVMALASCGLITLRDEALGVMSPSKLHAYLAMGLPIAYVGPAGSNVDEAIQRFGCGCSLRHGDSAGLVAFLERLRRDTDLSAQLRRRARAAFEAAYSDARTLPQFDALLESLAPRG